MDLRAGRGAYVQNTLHACMNFSKNFYQCHIKTLSCVFIAHCFFFVRQMGCKCFLPEWRFSFLLLNTDKKKTNHFNDVQLTYFKCQPYELHYYLYTVFKLFSIHAFLQGFKLGLPDSSGMKRTYCFCRRPKFSGQCML